MFLSTFAMSSLAQVPGQRRGLGNHGEPALLGFILRDGRADSLLGWIIDESEDFPEQV